MTDHETNVLKELSGDVKELSTKVSDLASDVRAQLVAEGECRKHVHSISVELWGVEGDQTKPGLKGQQRESFFRLNDHEKRLNAISDMYQSAKSRGITWLSGLVIALVGAIVGALAKHYWP